MIKKNIIGISVVTVGLIGLPCIPFSYIVGSWHSFFSLANMVSPLATYFGGFLGLFVYSALKISLYKSVALSSLVVNTLPGICANLYWQAPFLMSVLVPLISFVLFVVHPVGCSAFVYALLWVIPISVYCIKPTQFFFKALSATFVAHAVGSVLWLYFMPAMSPMTWIMLTPIALSERIVFAVGMSVVRASIYVVATYFKRCALCVKRWAM
jgi:hypothetical protein